MEWVEWFAEACLSLPSLLFGCRPEPGTEQHRELEIRVRREFNEERLKPAEQQDPERIRRLRIQDLTLEIEEGQYDAAAFQQRSHDWQNSAAWAACCKGANIAHRRIAASYMARAQYYRARVRQAQEDLSAALERRPVRIVEETRIELPAGVAKEMEAVAAIDLCVDCHKQLEQAKSQEELLRRNGQYAAKYYQRLAEEHEEAEKEEQQQEESKTVAEAACLAANEGQQQESSALDSSTGLEDLMERLDLQRSSSEDEHEVAEAAESEGSMGSPVQQQGKQASLLHLRHQQRQQAVEVS